MRGIAIDWSLSSISYMRWPLRVTFTPTGIPARSLKLAIDLRARRTAGFWPEIVASCSEAASRMAVDHVEALDVDPPLLRLGPKHLAGLAGVLAADHPHVVSSSNPERRHHRLLGRGRTTRAPPVRARRSS